VAGSATAMAAVAGSATAMAAVAGSATAMAAVAGSATAMAAIMENDAAQEVFWNVQYSFGQGLATYANINNSTLIGLQSLSAVAASSIAAKAVDSVINSYSDILYSALNSSSAFTKSTKEYSHTGASNGNHCTGQTATGNTIAFITYIKDTGSGTNSFIVSSMANNNQLINEQITNATKNYNPKKVALRGITYDFGTYYPNENRLGLEIFTVK
ncbi:MAG: hypothetical protein J6K31_05120, partial [Parabacteroides sp.]|nr:hypothetical protein [Parabacteroides sp.]